MFAKLSFFVIPFAFWIAYVLGLIALTELLIARKSKNRSEKRIMRTLAASFIGVGLVIFAALAAGVAGNDCRTLPQDDRESRFAVAVGAAGLLHLSLSLSRDHHRKNLVVVTFATVVLTVYVFGIRTIGDWMTQR